MSANARFQRMHASSVVGSDQASAFIFAHHACCSNCCFIRTNHVSRSGHRALQHIRVLHRSRRSRRPPEARQWQTSTCTQQRDLHVLESSSRCDAEYPHAQSGESEQAETLVCHWGLWKIFQAASACQPLKDLNEICTETHRLEISNIVWGIMSGGAPHLQHCNSLLSWLTWYPGEVDFGHPI